MKRILSLLTILALALVMAVCSSATEAKVIQPGDVNADSEIDIKDAVLLAQFLAGWDVQLGGDSHTVVIDKAVAPTCKTTGLTVGKHCSDCGMVLVKQQVIPTTDHDYEDTVVPPTETEKGYTFHKCKNCEYEYKDSYTNATLANGLEYEIANGTCTITGIGTCTETELYIPDTIENCNVTAIADKAFSGQTQLTKVELPKYIKTLGQRAFYGCTGLTEFTIPASVTSVGHQIFYKCSNLATVYYNSSFYPDQDKVFLNIDSIKTVVFGGTTIPQYILYNCSNVENVKIADSVKSTNYYSFSGCSNLKNLYITDIEAWMKVGFNSSPACPNVYVNNELLTELVIPESVTTVNSYPFSNCDSIEKVVVHSKVTSIAFSNCDKLAEINIPRSVKSISFYNCDALETVDIPDSVTSIDFEGCSSLGSIVIPDSVTSIGSWAFADCSSLQSIVIPDSVTSIGSWAFYNCSSLKNLYISDLESWLNVKLSSTVSHPLSSAGGNLYIDGVLATDIEIPDTVSSIGYCAFFNCDSITSVTIPDSVTSIGDYAFYYCGSLQSIVIPDSVTSIGGSAFWECSSLKPVYYGGDASDWSSISFGSDVWYNTNATRYYYSATAPTAGGNYWHYVDGVPTPW